MKCGAIALIAVLLAIPVPTWGQAQDSCNPRVDDRRTPACLLDAFISSMWEAHRTTLSAAPQPRTGQSAQEMVEDILYSTKERHRGYVAGLGVIAPYSENPREDVRTAAELVVQSLLALDTRDSLAADLMKQALDGTVSLTPSEQADRQAEFRSSRRVAAEGLIAAAGAVVMGIAQTDPATGRLACRRLTTRQVRERLDEIARLFGRDLAAGADGRFTTDFAVAIKMLRDSLRDPAWKPCA